MLLWELGHVIANGLFPLGKLDAAYAKELVEIERGAQKLYMDQLQWGHIHSDDDPDDRGNDPAQQQHSELEEFQASAVS